MSTLQLTLKKQWFDMIKSGFKKEEYREIKDYWVRRLIDFKNDIEPDAMDELITDLNDPYYRHRGPAECLKYFGASLRKFDAVGFRNGYGKERPGITMELKLISIGTGCTRMGAVEGKYYFILHLGNQLNNI